MAKKPNKISEEELRLVGRQAEIMSAFYDRIDNVIKKPLHAGQVKIAKDYFTRGMKVIQSQWGRSGGKTEAAIFIATVACALNDNFICYIITPERKQGKEIYWASKRLQDYPPPELIESCKDSELRMVFKNGSFICIDGCENYNAHRGLKPNLVIYDEFQNHSKEFHLEVMAPNLLAKQSSLIIFGTPPKQRSSFYVEFREDLLKRIEAGSVTRAYYEFKSEINPILDKEELANVRKELIESGNDVIWYREYEGRLAFGGEDVVFPKWSPQVHCRTHRTAMSYLEHDTHKLKWFTVCDPGTSSCFGVLFAAYNPTTQQIFILDEIYERDRKKTHSSAIWDRIRKKEKDLNPKAGLRDWYRVYDEQAAWFGREISANYQVGMIPTQKYSNKEEDGISKAKLLMSHPGSLIVSDRCYWLRWEIESYITDDNGEYVDKNNHLLDCLRYLIHASNWKMIERADRSLGYSEYRDEEIPTPKQNINEWADNVVENSLTGELDYARSPYSDFFDY